MGTEVMGIAVHGWARTNDSNTRHRHHELFAELANEVDAIANADKYSELNIDVQWDNPVEE